MWDLIVSVTDHCLYFYFMFPAFVVIIIFITLVAFLHLDIK